MVASGIVRSGGSRSPLYGNLTVVDITPGTIELTFDSYLDPADGKHLYIVKALPVLSSIKSLVVLGFGEFRSKSFTLLAVSLQGETPEGILKEMEFMIEVSEFRSDDTRSPVGPLPNLTRPGVNPILRPATGDPAISTRPSVVGPTRSTPSAQKRSTHRGRP